MRSILQFSIIYIILAASIFTFSYNAVSKAESKLSITHNQLEGVTYLKDLYHLSILVAQYVGSIPLQNMQIPRGIDNRPVAVIKKDIANYIENVYELQKRNPEFINDHLNDELQEIVLFNSSREFYYDFLEDINHENYTIGDKSKLLFEDEREMYFLSSLITHYMPEYLISILATHNIIEEYSYTGKLDKRYKNLFIEQSKLMYLSSEEISGILRLLNEGEHTKRLYDSEAEIVNLLEKIKPYTEAISNWKADETILKNYISISHDILELTFKVNNQYINIIEDRLKERAYRLENRIFFNKTLFVFLAIVIFIIFFFFYRSRAANIKKDIEIKSINDTLDKLVIFSKTDIEGNITYISSALEKLSGYTANELIGKTHRILKNEKMDPVVYEDLWKTILSKKTWSGEILNKAKDGSEYWVKLTAMPEFDDKNEITGFSAYRVDISNEKALEAEKVKTQEALEFKSKFLSNMSHEIRTPLNSIIGLLHVAQKTELNDKQRDLLEKVDSASNILLGVVNDILDISKIESGKMTIEQESFNVKESVQNVYNMLQPKAVQNGISLDINYSKIPDNNFFGDSLRISQILTNLVNNAIKFTSEGGVTIDVSYIPDNRVRFEVKDTGIGLKEEHIESLFDDFTQADMSTSRKYGGTGLGLSICKNLVDMMKGKIWVSSKYGEGSKFTFEIPLILDRDNKAQNNKNLKDIKLIKNMLSSIEDVKILVAEDNKMNQMVLSMLLEETKLDLDFADDGRIAVDKFNINNYDLVLMDIQMPNMNGFDATDAIRAEDPSIPIIGLSANAMQEDIKVALEHGMTDYLSKPIDLDELCRVLYKYLSKK